MRALSRKRTAASRSDVSVVGFDDILSAAFQNPSLTTVRQPLHEMGQPAAATLLSKLNVAEGRGDASTAPTSGDAAAAKAERTGKEPPAEITIEPALVVRESTGPAPGRCLRRAPPAPAATTPAAGRGSTSGFLLIGAITVLLGPLIPELATRLEASPSRN